MGSVADLLARARRAEKKLRINLDGTTTGRLDQLRDRIRSAKRQDQLNGAGLDAQAPALERELAALELEEDRNAVELVFRALPGERFDALVARFPPTERQWQRYREQAQASPLFAAPPEFDADSMAPILVAASIVSYDGEEVSWSDEDGLTLWAGLSEGARADLLEAAWAVNQQRSARPTSGTGTDTTPSSGPGSTTPPEGGSPSLSS